MSHGQQYSGQGGYPQSGSPYGQPNPGQQQGYGAPGQYGSQPQGYPPQSGYPQQGGYPPQQHGQQGQYGSQPQQGYPPQQGYGSQGSSTSNPGQYGAPSGQQGYPPSGNPGSSISNPNQGQYGAQGQSPYGGAPQKPSASGPYGSQQVPGQYPQPSSSNPGQYGSSNPGQYGSSSQSGPGQYGSSNPGQYGSSSQSGHGQYGQQFSSNPSSGSPGATYSASSTPSNASNASASGSVVPGNWASSYGSGVAQTDLSALQAWFNQVDADRSGNITANELAGMMILNKPIGLQVAQQLIKVFDKNYSGRIDFNEYVSLNQFVNSMQNAFYTADADRSGTLDYKEIFNALVAAGFNLQYPTIQTICEKYDPTHSNRISSETFVLICAQLASIRSIFEWNDSSKTGKVHLTYDELSHIVVHLFEKKP